MPPDAPAAPSPAAEPPTPLTPARRRLFVAITLALPWLLLGALELGLRLGGYGGDWPLFVAYDQRPGWSFPNPDVGRRWFPAGPFTPTPERDFFRTAKDASTYRIVFQGESSAQGFPYEHGGAPSRMLAQRLQATFPQRHVEVVNTALTAVNSYTLLDQADEIVAQRPDAVLIYTGHNEFYGVFGAGSTRALGASRPLVRAWLALRKLRTVQLLEGVIGAGAARASAGAAPRTVMQLMAGDQRIPLGSRTYARGLAQFRANLADLLARYQRAGIPVLIGTVASNERDQPPLGGNADAVAAWRRAGALNAAGDTARARLAYREAKERDDLRFRAPEGINAIIREEAARHGAAVVESQRALERAAPGGVVGATLMLEHLHPNLDGYFTIADAFYEAMRGRGMIGSWDHAVPAAAARRDVPVTTVDSLVGLLRADRLRSGWPFQPPGVQRVPVVDTLQARTLEERAAQALVLGNVSWPDAMEALRAHYEQVGNPEQATRVALAMAHEFRYSPRPYMDAARIAVGERRWDVAIRFVRAAVDRQETANSVQLLGLLLLRRGDHAGALPWLRRAAELAPANPRMRTALAAATALPGLEARRAAAPRDTAVLMELASAYAATQLFERSRETLLALRRVAPAHAGAAELLRRLPADSPAVAPPAPAAPPR